MSEPMSVQLRNLHDGVPCVCTCCGEPIAATWPDGELSCACEWEGCDESCPVTGECYREARRRSAVLAVIEAAKGLMAGWDDDLVDTRKRKLSDALVRFDALSGDDR